MSWYAELIDPEASIRASFRPQYLPVNPFSTVFACLLRHSKGLYGEKDFSIMNGNKQDQKAEISKQTGFQT